MNVNGVQQGFLCSMDQINWLHLKPGCLDLGSFQVDIEFSKSYAHNALIRLTMVIGQTCTGFLI